MVTLMTMYLSAQEKLTGETGRTQGELYKSHRKSASLWWEWGCCPFCQTYGSERCSSCLPSLWEPGTHSTSRPDQRPHALTSRDEVEDEAATCRLRDGFTETCAGQFRSVSEDNARPSRIRITHWRKASHEHHVRKTWGGSCHPINLEPFRVLALWPEKNLNPHDIKLTTGLWSFQVSTYRKKPGRSHLLSKFGERYINALLMPAVLGLLVPNFSFHHQILILRNTGTKTSQYLSLVPLERENFHVCSFYYPIVVIFNQCAVTHRFIDS